MDLEAQIRKGLGEGLARLRAKGLTGEAAAVFSARVPGQAAIAVAGDARASGAAAPCAVPALHQAVFRRRADAGAILTLRPPWASRLGRLPQPMPAVFDEQVRQLGRTVAALPLNEVRAGDPGDTSLSRGGNAFLAGEDVLTIGFTVERAIFNAELLEKCAKAYLLAWLTGGRIGTIPWLVRWIAEGRLRKDQARAAAAFARGELPGRFSTY